jgi:hypothetical protein
MDALTKWSETTAAKTRPRLSLKRVALLGLACIFGLGDSGLRLLLVGRRSFLSEY